MDVTDLTLAAEGDDVRAQRKVLKAGVGVNEVGRQMGWTALHWAAETRSRKAVRFLLGAGADPRQGNNYGVSALEVALRVDGFPVEAFDGWRS